MPSKKKKYNARFPAGRIKKIMQSDEEVGKVAQAVPIIISRTLELFVESLLQKTLRITTARNAKTLSPSHMRQCIMSENRFDFLRELVKNVPDINVAEEQQQQQQQQPSSAAAAASTSATGAGSRRPTPDSDDDVEFVSGNSTPTATPVVSYALPTDLSRRSTATYASTSSGAATSNGGQLKRNVAGDLLLQPPPAAAAQPPAYLSGLQPMSAVSHQSSPYPASSSLSSHQHSIDLSAAAAAAAASRSAAPSSMVANYYTEIDTSAPAAGRTNPEPIGQPQPQHQPALHRSASTPATAANYYNDAQISRPINLTPAAQPPVYNFDFSNGLPSTSIVYTAPSAAVAEPQQQHVPTTIVNVAIDQLTQTPLVKIDYSQLSFDSPTATISTPSSSSRPAWAVPLLQPHVVVATPPPPPSVPDVVKPRRGRPPKIRPLIHVGAGAATSMPAAPLSAPVRACAPYTPPTAEDYGRSSASGSSGSSSSSTALYKYQKSAKKFVRSSSSGGQQHHLGSASGSTSSSSSSVMAAAPLMMAATAAAIGAPPLMSLGLAAGSCLDMDEDYDNI